MSCALLKYIVIFATTTSSWGALRHQNYINNNRLTEVDWTNYNYPEPTGPGSYAFGYDIEDAVTNNVQFRNEERHANGSVTGSYGYLLPDGNVQVVKYIADKFGYRAGVEIMPRGSLKPVKVNAPENQLFDFSAKSNLNSPGKNNEIKPVFTTQYPYNIPNYVSAHLKTKSGLPIKIKPTSPTLYTSFYPTVIKTPPSFKNQFENYYLLPYH